VCKALKNAETRLGLRKYAVMKLKLMNDFLKAFPPSPPIKKPKQTTAPVALVHQKRKPAEAAKMNSIRIGIYIVYMWVYMWVGLWRKMDRRNGKQSHGKAFKNSI